MGFQSDPAQVAADDLLLTIVLNEDNDLGRSCHLLPTSGDSFGRVEVAPIRHELGRARLAVPLTEKPKAVEPRPLIQRLGVMRDEDEGSSKLPIMPYRSLII